MPTFTDCSSPSYQVPVSEAGPFMARGLRNPLFIEAKAVLVRALLVEAAMTVLTGITLAAAGGATAAFATERPAAPCSGFLASASLLCAESCLAGGMPFGAGAVFCSVWPFGWSSWELWEWMDSRASSSAYITHCTRNCAHCVGGVRTMCGGGGGGGVGGGERGGGGA